MTIFDSNLGKPLAEQSYAEDCRIFTPDNPESMFKNVRDTINDCHFSAHFVGWFVKMLIMRDFWLAWICSVSFEICELTFRHWLPNFYECWWDHLLLDLFGCNLIGIILGNWALLYFGVTKIKWIRQSQKKEKPSEPCSTQGIRSAIEKMQPDIMEVYEWGYLKNLNRLAGTTMFVLVCLTLDCNHFFLKYILWVPANHNILLARVLLVGICSIPAAKEYYEFMSNEHCHRMGPFSWCMILCISVETVATLKFSRNLFIVPFPLYVKFIWTVIGAGYAILIAIAWRNQKKTVNTK
jgi:phosphatidylserine synthase 2